MKKILKNNKIFIGVFLIILITFIYCSFNTFITNDDLPYSFYYRTDVRITNIVQVFKNQVADYFNINGRVILHSIVQTLLIFGKNLWSILNPIVIMISSLLIILISNLFNKSSKKDNVIKLLISIGLFLCLFDYKYIIYWVAGSVNYVWLMVVLLGFIYYYLKVGINNRYIVNAIIILFVSILHESGLVFMIIFILGDIAIKIIKKEKIDKGYVLYILSLIISALFILLCPGNNKRLDNDSWNSLGLIEKLLTSIPIVSLNLLNLRNIYNVIPWVYILVNVVGLLYTKDKKCRVLSYLIVIVSLLSLITNNGFIYFILSLLLFTSGACLFLIKKRYNMINISLGFYAIVFSMIIVSEYAAARPNYFFYIYSILFIIIILFDVFSEKSKKILTICSIIICFCLLGIELYIYTGIGLIKNSRNNSIQECRNSGCELLKLKKLDRGISKFHVDPNSMNKDNFAYRYFIDYYRLKDVEIEYVD